MSFLSRLFGYDDAERRPRTAAVPVPSRRMSGDDQRAVERYRYLIRTAPPETIERVHAEAFAKLTDDQRAAIYEELSRGAGTGERPMSSEPATLARSATRLEMRRPGSFERILQPSSASGSDDQAHGPGVASMVGSSLLGSVAGYVIGSALVSAFLPWGADDSLATDGDPVAGDADLGDADDFDLFADFGF